VKALKLLHVSPNYTIHYHYFTLTILGVILSYVENVSLIPQKRSWKLPCLSLITNRVHPFRTVPYQTTPFQNTTISNFTLSEQYHIKLHSFRTVPYQTTPFQKSTTSYYTLSEHYHTKLQPFRAVPYQTTPFQNRTVTRNVSLYPALFSKQNVTV
jgi:hypothetical protein